MTYKVLLYYHFNKIENPKEFASQHLAFCKASNILGRILISTQGISGTCAGTKEDIDKYKIFVHAIPGFKKTWFKEQEVEELPFSKIFVRHRDELVGFNNKEVDLEKGAKHISPEKLNILYEEHKHDDNLVIIDMRNDIEFQVGHFEGAINPGVNQFREVPKIMPKFKDAKNKTVVLYCTGGIRCELITPYFKEQGFKEIYQLKGGIYNYCNTFPNKHFKGDCFVFDKRMSVNFSEKGLRSPEEVPQDQIISLCKFCKEKSNRIVNEETTGGRDLVICCHSCDKQLDISRPRAAEEYKQQV